MGLVHRDIKPSNIIACERGGVFDVAKLLDFGIVGRWGVDSAGESLTGDQLVVGTPGFMSPEQIGGASEAGPAGDIYSVGAVGYFLVTGHPPFERSTPLQVLLAHLHDVPARPGTLNPLIPLDLEDVLLRCLSKNLSERFPDMHALDSALARCRSAGAWGEDDAAAWWTTHVSAHAIAPA
jgi:serine/threonine-protein kinase